MSRSASHVDSSPDATPPTLTVPADVDADRPTRARRRRSSSDCTLGTATASDNVQLATLVRSGVPAGNLFPIGVTTITWTATDIFGNQSRSRRRRSRSWTPRSRRSPCRRAVTGSRRAASVFISDAQLGSRAGDRQLGLGHDHAQRRARPGTSSRSARRRSPTRRPTRRATRRPRTQLVTVNGQQQHPHGDRGLEPGRERGRDDDLQPRLVLGRQRRLDCDRRLGRRKRRHDVQRLAGRALSFAPVRQRPSDGLHGEGDGHRLERRVEQRQLRASRSRTWRLPSRSPRRPAGSRSSTGATVTTTASFTDPGTADTHTCTITWGDGSTTTGTVSESARRRHVHGQQGVQRRRRIHDHRQGDGQRGRRVERERSHHGPATFDPARRSPPARARASPRARRRRSTSARSPAGPARTRCSVDWGDGGTMSSFGASPGALAVAHTYANDRATPTRSGEGDRLGRRLGNEQLLRSRSRTRADGHDRDARRRAASSRRTQPSPSAPPSAIRAKPTPTRARSPGATGHRRPGRSASRTAPGRAPAATRTRMSVATPFRSRSRTAPVRR